MNEMTVYEICGLIKAELQSTCDSFVNIGFYLKQVRDRRLYEETGHKDIWDFAQEQFGISKSSASRFMAINDKFSVDGNSSVLLEQYKDFSSSKLSEMLTLSDKQLEQRKDWIDAYQTWPLWVDLELTGERYYKFDFDNGVSFVVKVSTCHKWQGSKGYSEDVEYGREKYYVTGRESTENYRPKHPTFSECEENKSAMVEYLKEYQKK